MTFRLFCHLVFFIMIITSCREILAQSAHWKRANDRGNRYEGRIEIPIGKPELELLSFTGLLEPFSKDVTLRVRFFLPLDSSVSIEGRELIEQTQYWMASKPAPWQAGRWNEFGPWPTREVLDREAIPSRNLGVVIRLRSEVTASPEILPAFVYHATAPTTVSKYALYLRPNVDLQKMSYSLYRIVNDREAEVHVSSLVGDKVAGEPLLIELPVPDLAEGRMRLVIRGLYKNRAGGPMSEYTFYHVPQIR